MAQKRSKLEDKIKVDQKVQKNDVPRPKDDERKFQLLTFNLMAIIVCFHFQLNQIYQRIFAVSEIRKRRWVFAQDVS